MLAALAAYITRPRVFHSHNEVIVAMLEQQGMKVSKINSGLPWPDGVNYYAYGAGIYPYNLNVEVHLRDGRNALGRVECHRDQFDCQLTIAALGFDRTAMPNISNADHSLWPDWLRGSIQKLGIDPDRLNQ
jgi:hypothetical protein